MKRLTAFFWFLNGLFFLFLISRVVTIVKIEKETIDFPCACELTVSGRATLGYRPERGGSPSSTIDGDLDSFWFGSIDDDQLSTFEVSLKTPKPLSKIVIESSLARMPVDFSLMIKKEGASDFETLAIIKRNTQISREIVLAKRVKEKIEALRFAVSKTVQPDRLYQINEIVLIERLELEKKL